MNDEYEGIPGGTPEEHPEEAPQQNEAAAAPADGEASYNMYTLIEEVHETPEGYEQTPKPAPKKGEELFYWLQTLVAALVCIVIVFSFFGRITRVVGGSMDTTLADGQFLLVWSLGYEPEAGDIVVLNKTISGTLGDQAIVKRVVATGGQTVEIDYDTGTVYVDGAVLDEPYVHEMDELYDMSMQETYFEVPEGSVFVMGDNRNHSTDSRHLGVGAVDTRYILGEAVFRIFPFNVVGVP